MRFKTPLLPAIMIKRYKRFFADVELNGQIVTAHCPNTGSLKSCWVEGKKAFISESDNPDRKLKFTLEITEADNGALVGVNTSWPNKLVKEAFDNKVLKHWDRFQEYKSEVKISKETRLDGCLTDSKGKKRFIEIKNVTLADQDCALFPDAETTRGQKHLIELMKLIDEGHESEIVFTIQRGDCKRFSPAENLDPQYAKLLYQAKQKGVVITPVMIDVTPEQLVLKPELVLFK